VRSVANDNEYLIAKGNPEVAAKIKHWRLIEYYAALEQCLKEGDRMEAQREGKRKK
jgi:hypothetical protein